VNLKPIAEKILVKETGLSRIWQHIQSSKTFAVISAFRGSNTEEVNLERHNSLKNDVRSLGHGFIEQKSGYTYANPETGEEGNVDERSLFIPNISKEDAVALGKKYQQESILWKDADEFVILYVDSGKTDAFNRGSGSDLTFDPSAVKFAFSQFLKSKNKNAIKKFAYVLKELSIPSREDAYKALKEKTGLPQTKWVDVF